MAAGEPRSVAATSEPRGVRTAVALGLVAGVCAAYAPVGGFAYINFDDPQYVTANPLVRQGFDWANVGWVVTQPHAKLWHPLASLSHLLDVSLFGLDPGPPHLVNAALHAASTWACFVVLLALTGRLCPSAVVAVLFGWHPARVESVAWIAERKDVLSTLFAWTTLGAWAHWVRAPSRLRYALVFVSFAAAVLSKSMMVTLPAVLLLVDVWPLGRLRLGWRVLVVEKLPLGALAVACAAVTYHVQREGGAVAGGEVLDLSQRAGNAAVAYVRYLALLAWPSGLAIFYPFRTWSGVTVALAGTTLAALTAGALAVRRRAPYVTVGWLWYLVTLFPVSGIVQAGSQSMADRFTYWPSVGLAIALTWTIADHLPATRAVHRGAGAGAVAIAIVLLVLTARQVRTWRDSETVFRHAIAVTGDNYLAQNQLGEALAAQQRYDEAAPHYAESARLNPTFPEAQNNLGNTAFRRGDATAAEAYFRRALALDATIAEAHNGLGTALARRGDLPGATAAFRTSVRLRPDYAEALANLGDALRAQADFAGAVEASARARALRPDWLDVRVGLAAALAGLGRVADARAELDAVVRTYPDYMPAQTLLAELRANPEPTAR